MACAGVEDFERVRSRATGAASLARRAQHVAARRVGSTATRVDGDRDTPLCSSRTAASTPKRGVQRIGVTAIGHDPCESTDPG